MEKTYVTSFDDVAKVSAALSVGFDAIEEETGAHIVIIGMAALGLVIERAGREGLDHVLHSARLMRQQLMAEEKAETRAAKQARRQQP